MICCIRKKKKNIYIFILVFIKLYNINVILVVLCFIVANYCDGISASLQAVDDCAPLGALLGIALQAYLKL